MIWPQLFDELPYRSHALLSGQIAFGPPMSVFTHPGLTTTQVIPCGARSMAALGPLRVIEAFLDNVARSDRKLVVNITSGMGSLSDNTSGGSIAYRTSKAAVNMVTRKVNSPR